MFSLEDKISCRRKINYINESVSYRSASIVQWGRGGGVSDSYTVQHYKQIHVIKQHGSFKGLNNLFLNIIQNCVLVNIIRFIFN